MAKLIAHGEDRGQAIEILLDALADTDVEGVETNRTLLVDVLGHPDFQAARVTTDWLERVM
jgi:acetyl/propionyl-CoA carboxylase alpha subunit